MSSYAEPYILSDTAILISLCGIGVLLAVVAVMVLVKAVGKSKDEPAADTADAVQTAPQTPAPPPAKIAASGSQGDLDLYNVDDRTAALLMAIAADTLNAPLNTLRFTSIREVG